MNLLILLAVMFVGTSALGAQRWIRVGPITIQPSEFSADLRLFARRPSLSDKVDKLNSFKSLLPIGLFVGIPFLLVLKQPDLGTSLVFLAQPLACSLCSHIKLSLLRNILQLVLSPRLLDGIS